MKDKNAAIARRLASQYWGLVQEQKKLGDGVWWFSTDAHGGIVVDTDVRTALKDHQSPVSYRDQGCLVNEQHFAAFEEDCEISKVEWTYPSLMPAVAKLLGKTGDFEEWKRNRCAVLKKSLEMWNPDWLKRHPQLGWGEPTAGDAR